MTTPHILEPHGRASVGCPRGRHAASGDLRPIPIYGTEFSRDPRPTFAQARLMGPIAPVEIYPGVYGYMTTGYRSALFLLRNTPTLFAKDPRNWQAWREGQIPADSPALMMMMYRENALWMDGPPHTRLRGSITDSLDLVDTHALERTVARIADNLIDNFAARGYADLVEDLARPLPMQVLMEMFGCPQELGWRIVGALAMLFDASQDSAKANAELEAACLTLARLRRREPAADMTSWLLNHRAQLTDQEMIQQILLVVGAGTEPSTNLIGNILMRMITDGRLAGNVYNGVQSISEVLDETLWDDPPMRTYSPLYPCRPMAYEGITLHPGIPILVSFGAANSDPDLLLGRRAGNRAHLAFSAGAHGCPAPDLARVLVETAIERVLDRLPDLTLACRPDELTRRPGTFHSGWNALPVRFPPTLSSPMSGGFR